MPNGTRHPHAQSLGHHHHETKQSTIDSVEEWYKQQAHQLSHRWGERLTHFDLPCPICNGELEFQGARRNPIFEFAEGEPGVLTPLNLLTLSFTCNRCGYNAEFDSDLFKPALLAELQGASESHIAELSASDYRVLVTLSGQEKNPVLLDLASAIASAHGGDVVALHVGDVEARAEEIRDRLNAYRPPSGEPSPVQLIQATGRDQLGLSQIILKTASQQQADLLLIGWRGWSRSRGAFMGRTLDIVLHDINCAVAVVHDRGMEEIDRILVPYDDSPHFAAALQFAKQIATARNAELHLLTVSEPSESTAEQRSRERINHIIDEAIALQPNEESLRVERHRIQNANRVQTIVSESSNYDLLVLAAPPSNWRGMLRHSPSILKMARNAAPTTVVVRSEQNAISSWLHRIFT